MKIEEVKQKIEKIMLKMQQDRMLRVGNPIPDAIEKLLVLVQEGYTEGKKTEQERTAKLVKPESIAVH